MLSDDETMVVQRAYMRYREAYNGPLPGMWGVWCAKAVLTGP